QRRCQRPAGFAQSDGLTNEPRAGTNPLIFVWPMLWFVDRLAIEFKNEFGMSGFQNVSVNVLMTGDARICAHVKISQVMHASTDARRVGPIAASMSAQPRLSRTVTTFARHAFVGMRGWRQATLNNGLKG